MDSFEEISSEEDESDDDVVELAPQEIQDQILETQIQQLRQSLSEVPVQEESLALPLTELPLESSARNVVQGQPQRQSQDDDFVSQPKKRKIEENAEEQGEECQGNQVTECIICFEPCTTGGPHRLVTLKCGHLFGNHCIKTWIGTKRNKNKACPACKKPTALSHIIPIFTKNVILIDASERDAALLQALEAQKKATALEKENQRILSEAAQIRLLCEVYQGESQKARNDLLEAKRLIERMRWENSNDNDQLISANEITPLKKGYCLKTFISVGNQSNSARVMSFCEPFGRLLVGKKDPNSARHGIWNILMIDSNHQDFFPIHEGTIRDLHVSHHEPNLILTGSVDRTLKLTSQRSRVCVQSFELDAPVWSCSFDPLDPHHLYAGTSNNQTWVFDIRFPGTALKSYSFPWKNGKGIHSLLPISPQDGHGASIFGSCFDTSFLLTPPVGEDREQTFYEPQISALQIDKKTCTNLSFDSKSRMWASTWRTASGTQYQFGKDTQFGLMGSIDVPIRQMSMTRSTLLYTHPITGTLTLASSGHPGYMQLWSSLPSQDQDSEKIEFGTPETIDMKHSSTLMDIKCCLMQSKHVLASLSDERLSFFEWIGE